MGSHSSSGGKSNQSSQTVETQLSKEQAAILKTHESQYQEHFFPELINELESSSNGAMGSTYMQGQSKAINNASSQAQSNFTNDMNQRDLTGSGTEAQGMIALSNAKTSALADAYYNTTAQMKNDKMNTIQLGLGMSPTPTTAAPMGQQSSGSGKNESKSFGLL